ncbi:hypothetical protein C9374_007307 [Naegleria lovaniensis]|uniref:Saposin B-type domain-containing protein n=1 Tax=Naegleria lovaniensis TaxID=51637 RepID=A0AA88H796_NAELO|nr:uncharacterized protein C9374_007307 [Naegleria lovaniensis]KAG2393776.1 hypothetical protein C9374_007307 [Naegleria lovaniensis]
MKPFTRSLTFIAILCISLLLAFALVQAIDISFKSTQQQSSDANLSPSMAFKEQVKNEVLKDKELTNKLINYSLNKLAKKSPSSHHKPSIASFSMVQVRTNLAGSELCEACVNLLDFAVADLMAAIDTGVVVSCVDLCQYVPPLFPYAYQTCELLCTVVGVNAFIAILKKADLDPVYGCQLMNVCPIHDCTAKTCATFTSPGVSPQVSECGGKVLAYSRLNVFNESGPGQVILQVTGPFSVEQIIERYYQANGFMPGSYEIKFEIKTQNDDSQDLMWFPGLYKVVINACEGECGASRPHSRLLAQVSTNFTLTTAC